MPDYEVPQSSKRRVQRRSLEKLIQEVFNLDDRIRFIAVYQDQYLLAGGMRESLESYDPADDAHDVDLQLAKIGEIARAWQRWFGKLSTFVLRYEKINLAFQPLREGRFLVLSSEPAFDPLDALERLRRNPDYELLLEGIP